MASTGIDPVQQHPQLQQLIFPAAVSRIEVSEQLIKYNQTDDSTAKAVEYFYKYLDELNTRAKMAQKMKKHCGLTCNCGLVGPPLQSLKKSWQLPFLQRHQTKFWQKQAPVLRCWRYQNTTQSMTMFWNIWIFPFHMVKSGLERSRYMFSSFWRTVFFD